MITGKTRPVYHGQTDGGVSFDLCSDSAPTNAEYVRFINDTDHNSVTFGVNNDGFEQYYSDHGYGMIQ